MKTLKKQSLRVLATLLLGLSLFTLFTLSASAAQGSVDELEINETSSEKVKWKYNFPPTAAIVDIEIDGVSVLKGEAAIIEDTTYVPLRSFSELFFADSINWNEYTRTATVKKGSTDVNIKSNSYYIEAEGRYV